MLKKFILLVFVLSWILTGIVALQTHKIIPFQILPSAVSWLAGLIPGIVAVLVVAQSRKFLVANLKKAVSWKAALIIVALTIGFLLVVVLIHKVASDPIELSTDYVFLGIQFVIWGVLAFGEELGWRGFALPTLMQGRSRFRAIMILGIIWCVWHYPKILGSPFLANDVALTIRAIFFFSIQILAGNLIICWLFLKFNKSVWTATLYHTLWNVVSTVYLFMAMDVYATILISLVAIVIVVSQRQFLAEINEEATDF